ncbi:MAG: hypothetical protein LDL27_01860 [Desulfovibrio sp.]|nr:hypothetical protein [Desulfovibrio sp.]
MSQMTPEQFNALTKQLEEWKEDTEYQLQTFFDETRELINENRKRYNRLLAILAVSLLLNLYSTSFLYTVRDYAVNTTQHINHLYENLMRLVVPKE